MCPENLDDTISGEDNDPRIPGPPIDELLQLPMLRRLHELLRRMLLRRELQLPADASASSQPRLLLSMSAHRAMPDTESIWRTLSAQLRQFIRSRVASTADADDVLQNVFLRIHRHLPDVRESERLESWVFQVARNAIIDHHRKKPLDPLDAEQVPAPHDAAADNLNAEVAGCLDAMLAQLPEPLQRAVAMYEREGVSQLEIAEREAISLSGAKSRVQRGRRLLKDMLEQCCQLQMDRYGNAVAWDAPKNCDPSDGACQCRENRN